MSEPIKTEADWKALLTPEQYHVLREKGTEPAWSGEYDHTFDDGMYRCAACGNELFSSVTKYDSGCGWPAFWSAIDPSKVTLHDDTSFGMQRIEVKCAKCGSHLGHVFEDGPSEHGGKRFCINSLALNLEKENKSA
jgi:peptide-methionine (R)-S-oxide reductase